MAYPPRPLLVSLEVSPWSKRAKWLLAEAGCDWDKDVDVVKYNSFVDEPWLRYRLGEWRPWATVSVPVLFVRGEDGGGGERALRGSGEMARHVLGAGSRGGVRFSRGATVWLGDAATLERVETVAERVMAAGRHLACARVVAERPVAHELLVFPASLLPDALKAWTVAFAFGQIQRKYARPEWATLEGAERDVRAGLDEIRALVRAAKPSLWLCVNPASGQREFSYVDIVAVMALAFASMPPSPAAKDAPPLSQGYRRVEELMTDPILAAEYGDLVEWGRAVMSERRVVERARF